MRPRKHQHDIVLLFAAQPHSRRPAPRLVRTGVVSDRLDRAFDWRTHGIRAEVTRGDDDSLPVARQQGVTIRSDLRHLTVHRRQRGERLRRHLAHRIAEQEVQRNEGGRERIDHAGPTQR